MIQCFTFTVIWIGIVVLAVPVVTFVCECVIAMFGRVTQANDSGNDALPPARPTIGSVPVACAVVIPAHNEEKMLAETLVRLNSERSPGDRVIVIADNCDDQTAEIALSQGVEVLRREDPDRRGKGFAMQFALDALRDVPPDVVVFLDADCQFKPGGLDALVSMAARQDAAVQSRYLMHRSEDVPGFSVISEFAVLVKNWVRLRALQRCSIGVPLTGSGMAFPWGLAESVELASGNLVEDMDLSCQLTCRNRGALFCERSIVTAPLPDSKEAAVEQRRRWEQGHLKTICSNVPPMLLASLRFGSLRILGSAIDLCVPPLTLLMVLLGTLWLASLAVISIDVRPIVLATVMVLATIASVLAVALRFSKDRELWRALVMTPVYVFRKLPIYLRLVLRQGRSEWIRTAR